MLFKRWIRVLRRAEDPGLVIRNEKYWNDDFFPFYLELVEDIVYDNPKAGCLWARTGTSLAVLIDAPGRFQRLARAYAVLGSAELEVGDLEAAEKALQNASKRAQGLNEREQANIWVRLTDLKWEQRCRDEALRLVERAISIYRSEGNRRRLCPALQKRGIQRYLRSQEGALDDLVEALELAEPRTRSANAAVHNLATALALGAHGPEALGDALRQIRGLRRASRLRSVQEIKLLWIEGLLLAKMLATRRAAVVLEKARDRLATLGAAHSAVLAGLDLAALSLRDRSEDAAEILELANRLGLEDKALAALKLWVDASHENSWAALETARQALDARARVRG